MSTAGQKDKKMLCCPNCLSHKWLKERITEISKETGQCEFCGSESVSVSEASELGDFFDNLLSMYVVANSYELGEPLISLIQWHWRVFDEDVLDEDSQAGLLQEIANSDWDDDDGDPPLNARELYQPLGGQFHTTHRERWEEFCSEVRQNPNAALPFEDYFGEDFSQLAVTLPMGTSFYRARRGFNSGEYGERQPFQSDEIGAPPSEKARAGRANVERQRVLYCADQEPTAVAEVRPARGYYVSVAILRLNREIKILDLTKELDEINPFTTSTLKWDVQIRSLLGAFAEEMSRPLERDDDPNHYLPCQRLAHYIRDTRYDGIRYPSALNPNGTNVVLFDPGVADVKDSKLLNITGTSLKYESEPARGWRTDRVSCDVRDDSSSADSQPWDRPQGSLPWRCPGS